MLPEWSGKRSQLGVCVDQCLQISRTVTMQRVSFVESEARKLESAEGGLDCSEEESRISRGSYRAKRLANCDESTLWTAYSPVLMSITEKPK